ncbi:MAG: HAMP domain-containing histidine kinase [Nitrospirae bacterium]|nr:HAMP domain-containing histidine kinase [Nitrospirota bacterium]
MKTKIFLAFLIVIFSALLTNFVFEWIIIRDFDDYAAGIRDDQFFWIKASVESSYSKGRWDAAALAESIHWAMMLGLDLKVIGLKGGEIITSQEVMSSLSDTMKHTMEGLFHIHHTGGRYNETPLYIGEKKIGTLLYRPFQKEWIKEKEAAFKRRTRNFLYVSLLIAGGGLLIAAMLLSRFLSRPITRLKLAAQRIAGGDFSVRIAQKGHDEVSQLSESFNKMAESLHKEEELRKHLMSNIAHELRTPLTIMKTHIEAMEDGIIKDPREGLENIRQELNRLIKLIKGIEDITAAEAGFFTKGELTEINLKEFLSGITGEMARVFRDKGLEINIVSKNDLTVVADVEKLEKIVRNIISNSLKFTLKGGVWIDYGVKDKDFFIEIRDSGIGISEEDLQFIFNRFYKVKRRPYGSEEEKGLGLGLAIVKELVSVMGGRIDVKSRVNEGATFRVYLPMAHN